MSTVVALRQALAGGAVRGLAFAVGRGLGWGVRGAVRGTAQGASRVQALAWALLALPGLAQAVADPQVASFVDDDPVVAGARYTYTVRVDNNATDASLNTRLRLVVPSGASFVSAAPSGANCVATSATQIDCNLGTVAGGGADPRDVVFTWRATVPGLAVVNATATVSADNDSNTANNELLNVTTVNRGANLALAMAGAPNPVVGGANVSYTLTASNAGPNAADTLVLTHSLSPSSTFVSASGTGWVCSHASGTVSCSRAGPHAVGAAIPPVTVVATVTAASGTITSSATVANGSGGPADPEAADNTASVSTTVSAGADLTVASLAVTSANPASSGGNVTLLLQPRNLGPALASTVSVQHTLPAGWAFVSASGTGYSCSTAGLVATCTRATLAVGTGDNITVVATAPVVGARTSYTHSAQISAATADPVAPNNSASVVAQVQPDGADLLLQMLKTPNPVAQGSPLETTVVVTNNGPRVATGPLRVVLVLSGETYAGVSGSGWSCSAAASVVTCNHANSANLRVADALPPLVLSTTATATGTVSSTACTGGSVPSGAGAATASPPAEGDPNAGNDCATLSSLSTSVRPDLAIAKTTSTPTGGDKLVSASEASVTYTLVVSNVSGGSDAATGIRITDTVPGVVSGATAIATPVPVVSAGSAAFSCAVAGATVTCTQTAGALAPGQSVSVPIVVSRPLADGSFTNTATVANTAEGDPVSTNNSASDTVTIAPIADVQMTGKAITPSAGVRAGEPATYVLSFRNNGPSTATGVVVTDTFTFASGAGDTGFNVVSIASSAAGSTCSVAAGSAITPAANSFNCSIGSMANGQAETITLVLRPNFMPANPARTVTNTARITTTSVEHPSGGDNGNNSQSALLEIAAAQVDLLVNTTDATDPVPYASGATWLDYRVRVNSVGPSYATNVRITQTMTPPAGRRVRFVCDTTALGSGTCNTTPLCSVANVTSAAGTALPAFTCSVPAGNATTGAGVGELARDQAKDIFLRFEALDQPGPSGDVFSTTATVSAAEPDVFSTNNAEGETTTTRQHIDLRLTKAASQASVTLRQPFNWVVTVVNNGPGASLQTDVTDTLPAGTELTGPATFTRTAPAGSGSCTATGLSLACALGQLDAGGSATITVPVRILTTPSGGTQTNTASVDADPTKTGGMDIPSGDTTGSATVSVTGRASIAGTVFDDSDRSGANGGVPQAGEARIAGVSVRLTGTDAYGAPVDQSTTTDAAGNYLFDDLPPSGAAGYTLTQTQPAGYGQGPVAVPASGADAPSAGGSYAAGSLSAPSTYTGIVLAAGTTAVRYHFPERLETAISGTVYLDRNGNGSRDATPTDARLAGVTLTLYAGTSCSGSALASTATDSDGAYSFTGLSAGAAYSVCQTQPAVYADGTTTPGTGATSTVANRIAIAALAATGSTGNDFGERAASLAGQVFLDANHDGLRQAGDSALAGVTLTLSGTDAAGNPVSRSTSTDATGAYRFDDLPAANATGYTVTEQAAQPVVTVGAASVTTLNGRTVAGSVGGSATAPGTTPSRSSAIVLPAGVAATGYDFAEILPSTVSGRVFVDAANNGAYNPPADAGIAGVTITLTGTDDTGAAVGRTLTTDANGQFSATDLRPGTYTLAEPTQPVGTGNGLTTPGTGAGSTAGSATPVATTPSAIGAIVLATPGTVNADNLFAEVPASAALTGRVWLDANHDGLIGSAESPIAGVGITLTGTDSGGQAVSRSTTTDASGVWRFDGLAAGTYTVTEPSQPSATLNGTTRAGDAGGSASAIGTVPSAVTGIVLASGQVGSGYDFGEIPAASVSGRVWADPNDNGRIDAGESGLSGVTVQLSGTDDLGQPVAQTTTTAADGGFRFDGLRPGTYTLTEPTQPAGTTNGQTLAGVLGGSATAVGTVPSAITGIVLGAGTEASGNLFGEVGDSADLRVAVRHNGSAVTVGVDTVFTVDVRNSGNLPSSGTYTVQLTLPDGLTLWALPSTPGWTCAGAVVGASSLRCETAQVLAPGASHPAPLQVPVAVGAAAAAASPVQVRVLVEGGGELDARRPSTDERSAFTGAPTAPPLCVAAVDHNVCRDAVAVQLPASVAGTVWFDLGAAPRVLDAGDQRLPNWQVEVTNPATGTVVARAVTGADGSYRITGLEPGLPMQLRFRDPVSGVVLGQPVNGETASGSSGATCAASGTPEAGRHSSCPATGADPHLAVVLAAGQLLPQQSLPVDPSGVVYDSITRAPVPGAVVTLAPVGSCAGWSPTTGVVGATLGGYRVSGDSIAMTVGAQGFYQFWLSPAAPASCAFSLTVTPPSGYSAPSVLIPPASGSLRPTGAVGSNFAVQPQAGAPTGSATADTLYHLALTLGSATAGVVHNHVPLDPVMPTGLALSKTGDKRQAEVGDSVRYTITVAYPAGPRPVQTTVVDRLPAGFTYVRGTAQANGVPIADPQGGLGPTLAFQLGTAPADGRLVLQYRVRVGVGAQQGDGINRAQAHGCARVNGCVDAAFAPLPGGVSSNEGQHRVQVSGGVFTAEACVLGKVFIDCNGNHVQDREELGIPGVRLVLSDGTNLVSDSEGKYSVCGLPPRGHVLRVDPLTLPRGARMTTSSNRNLGDAGSLWLDLKFGELHRADFIEGSCSNTVLEQTKARRAQGEVRAPETEKRGTPALRFDSKAHGLDTQRSPQQGTDGANQAVPKPRPAPATAPAKSQDEQNVPTPDLPMNRPPPTGRGTGTAPNAPAAAATAAAASAPATSGAANGTR